MVGRSRRFDWQEGGLAYADLLPLGTQARFLHNLQHRQLAAEDVEECDFRLFLIMYVLRVFSRKRLPGNGKLGIPLDVSKANP